MDETENSPAVNLHNAASQHAALGVKRAMQEYLSGRAEEIDSMELERDSFVIVGYQQALIRELLKQNAELIAMAQECLPPF